MAEISALLKGLRVLKLLPGHALNGLSNQQIAEATNLSPSAVTRILQTLIEEGLAEKTADGRFVPGMGLARLGVKTLNELDSSAQRIDEMRARIAASINY